MATDRLPMRAASTHRAAWLGLSPRQLGLAIAAVVVLAALPFAIKNDFYVAALISVLFWAAAAAAWNINGGFAGELSLGHSAFFGIGAYASTILAAQAGLHFSPWLGMIVGAILSSAFALFIGFVSIRLRGPFFAMVTMAFAQVLYIVAVNWKPVTNGASGMSILGRPSLESFVFAERWVYAEIMLALLVLVVLVTAWIRGSRLGLQLAAFRENRDAARALGVNILKVRLQAFAISAALTACLGTFQAQYIQFIDPDSVFGLDYSVQVALLTIVGGQGTVLGPVLGSIVVTPLGQVLLPGLAANRQGLNTVVYGVILIAVILLIPDGILAVARRRWRAWQGRGAAVGIATGPTIALREAPDAAPAPTAAPSEVEAL